MGRKFISVCAGMFLLALSYHFGANTAGAQSAGFASPTEVAVLSGVLRNGETIPLPTYADGTTALESECHWTVSNTAFGAGDTWCFAADAANAPPIGFGLDPYEIKAYVTAHPGRVMNAGHAGGGGTYDGNYMIIATRASAGPTPAQQQSWGQLKSRYAPGGSTSQPAVNR